MSILVILSILSVVTANKTVCYLQHYGYLQNDALTDDITASVKLLQETYGLQVDGQLNNETLAFINRPRCGNPDELLPFTADPNIKWRTNTITWYMYGNNQYDTLIEQAFNVWARHANLTFKKSNRNPMITMAFGKKQHVRYATRTTCESDFDGPGGVLAHAYRPEQRLNQSDVHFDSEETWDYTMNIPSAGSKSFYTVLLHEIGHALGLSHSYVKTSLMWAMYESPQGIPDLRAIDLDIDDIRAIQFLYGTPPPTTTSSTTTTNTPSTTTTTLSATTPTPAGTTDLHGNDICNFKHKINTYLVVDKYIYAFYQNYVWVLSLSKKLRTKEQYTRPKIITHWLPFLNNHFTNITAIYQRPNDEIVLFIEKSVYVIQYPDLNLIRHYNLDTLIGRPDAKINAVVNTNQGKTYALTDDFIVFELDECSFRGKIAGVSSKIFEGVPNSVKGAFRYINGNIYFITDSSTLEFNEFVGTVTKNVPDLFELLDISCIRDTLLQQLYAVLRYLQ